MTDLLVLLDPPLSGIDNMARDEALLNLAAAGEVGPALRFYEWSPPTLSLGYFQQLGAGAEHAASRACPVVRRASGGGAILHDRELTYALALPGAHPLAARAEPLYRAVHQSLIAALAAEWNIAARFWDHVLAECGTANLIHSNSQDGSQALAPRCDLTPPRGPNDPERLEPFLCFERRAAGDLVIAAAKFSTHLPELRNSAEVSPATLSAGWTDSAIINSSHWFKVLGSAQRRRRGAVLQHGSLLLASSPFAPELPGITELTGQKPTVAQICAAWLPRLAKALQMRPQPGDMRTPGFVKEFTIAQAKFAARDWLVTRS